MVIECITYFLFQMVKYLIYKFKLVNKKVIFRKLKNINFKDVIIFKLFTIDCRIIF